MNILSGSFLGKFWVAASCENASPTFTFGAQKHVRLSVKTRLNIVEVQVNCALPQERREGTVVPRDPT